MPTDRQRDVLLELRRYSDRCPDYAKPRDLGACNGSQHSAVLARFVDRGWAERKQVGGGWCRPAWGYRITDAGREALS